MSEARTAYPLSWPEGWPRTARHLVQGSRFGRPTYNSPGHSMEDATGFLSEELRRLGATNEVLSTNVQRRLDGVPYSNRAQPADTGVAVYFTLKGKETVLACDRWKRVEDNVHAIAKHIESLRGQARWGVGSMEQAFRGYAAIPERTGGVNWWEVLGIPINATEEQVKEAYRVLARKHHPDLGGDKERFIRLQEAYEQAQYLFAQKVA